MFGKWSVCASATAIALSLAAPGLAQTSAAGSTASLAAADTTKGLEEIVVTAQRTNQSLQKVPIAVSVVTAKDAEVRGLNTLLNLTASVPALEVQIQGSAPQLYLRGVGTDAASPNTEPSVALYVDGVYYPSAVANLFTFNNIERVEVLKGPQGTLFGRNATAGVIQIVTRDPQQTPTISASFGYGSYGTVDTNAYVSAGLTHNLAADLAVTYQNQNDGFGRDITTGQDVGQNHSFGVRGKLLFTPDARTEIRLMGDYSDVYVNLLQQLAPGVIGIDGQPGFVGRYDTKANFPTDNHGKQGGVALRIDRDLDFARLISITSYRRHTALYNDDLDSTAAPIVNAALHERQHDWTQELQLLSPKTSSVQWVVGAFYFDGSGGYEPFHLTGAAAAPFAYLDNYGTQRVKSASIYGQATIAVVRDTHLTAGLRYTDEKITLDGQVDVASGVILVQNPPAQKLHKPTWRLALDHDFSDDIKAYISYNRGIKSGGFNIILPTSEFKPEVLDAYELGLKTELFDRRLRLNLAAFYYDYKDIQVTVVDGAGTTSSNAALAHIKGIDADFRARLGSHLNISGGGSYLDGHYVKYPGAVFYPASPGGAVPDPVPTDASGEPTIYTPRWTANIQADYRIDTAVGPFTLSGSLAYFGGASAEPFDTIRNPAYTLVNGSLGWAVTDHLGLRLWVKNVTDANYTSERIATAFGTIQIPAPPRTYGASVNMKF